MKRINDSFDGFNIGTIINIAVGIVLLFVIIRVSRMILRGGKATEEDLETASKEMEKRTEEQTNCSKTILDVIVENIYLELTSAIPSAKDIALELEGLTEPDLAYVYNKFGVRPDNTFFIMKTDMNLFGWFDEHILTPWGRKKLKEIFVFEPYKYS